MEPKFCPLLSIDQPANQPCERCHCAFWVEKPGNEGCAVAVLAEEMQSASVTVEQISESVSEICTHTTPTNSH